MNVERGSDHLITAHNDTTREERAAASRAVLKQARNREDLRLLLDALGLNNKPDDDS
ncbi:hypothetical protein ACH4ND_01350 [Streptomyces sp. NPDC017179]|uniref:hypothetical protein n=1 Tax=Streptomyces sp. NPDC017179 TaxID=3364979 RepID=UPI00379C9B8F